MAISYTNPENLASTVDKNHFHFEHEPVFVYVINPELRYVRYVELPEVESSTSHCPYSCTISCLIITLSSTRTLFRYVFPLNSHPFATLHPSTRVCIFLCWGRASLPVFPSRPTWRRCSMTYIGAWTTSLFYTSSEDKIGHTSERSCKSLLNKMLKLASSVQYLQWRSTAIYRLSSDANTKTYDEEIVNQNKATVTDHIWKTASPLRAQNEKSCGSYLETL